MKTYHKTVSVIFTCFFFLSCFQDVIDLDLKEIEPQVVIEGYINDQSSSPMVTISLTSEYDREPEFIPGTGADVMIFDNQGDSASFSEIQPGVYQAHNFPGKAGNTYTLIVHAEGKRYEASSTLPNAIELDEYLFHNEGPPRFLTCSFRDREGQEDFCRIKIYKQGIYASRYLYHGHYSDGELIILDDFGVDFYPGQTADIEMMTIDQNVYDYLAMLNEIDTDPDGNDGDDYNPEMPEFFPATYFNPKSNFSNHALGYFSAFSLRTYTLTYNP